MKGSLSPIQRIVAMKTFDNSNETNAFYGNSYKKSQPSPLKGYRESKKNKNFYKFKNVIFFI